MLKRAKQTNEGGEVPEQKLMTLVNLAEAVGVRYSTIKYYTQMGLLPYEKVEGKAYKYYDPEKVKPVINDINKLKDEGKTITDIVIEYSKQGKLANDVNMALLNLTKTRTYIKKPKEEKK